jgi:hypothetical protein
MKEHQALISCVAAALTAAGAGFALLDHFRPARHPVAVLVQPPDPNPENTDRGPGGQAAQPPKPETAQPPPKPDGEDGVQVLTRGPVHEAFAEAVVFDPEPSVVVREAPPDAVDEAPPDQGPEDAAWIPGYAAWDDERGDYVWASGVWRSPPPGRQWVSGYWGRCESGFQWVPGYWAAAEVEEIEYLPEPPAAVEAGPVGVPPSADHGWIPGAWVWWHRVPLRGRYAWCPGYWVAAQADWDWIPPHCTWTPRGYVFVDGYWDYPVARRGVLFAPVRFDAAAHVRFSYSPSVAIDAAALADHLFVRPEYHSYYFGDYYDAGYSAAGFYWACSFNATRRGYDPIWAHRRWEHRRDGGWEARVEADFRNRRDHAEARPPRTLVAQDFAAAAAARRAALGAGGRAGSAVAVRLDQLAKGGEGPARLRAVDGEERRRLAQRGDEVRRFREERRALEAPAEPAHGRPRAPEPDRARLPKPAIAAKPAEGRGGGRTPPRRHEAPAPDPKVEARPRGPRAKEAPRQEPRGKPNAEPRGKPKRPAP